MLPIDEGLLLEGNFPVAFSSVDDFPGFAELAIINQGNESFLRICLSPQEPIELDEHDEVSLELRRQELKINLLLDMVGELLAKQKQLPAPVKLNLTSLGMEWPNNAAKFKVGEKLAIALYISPPTPKELRLYGEVVAGEGDETTAIHFVGLNQSVKDWLEKFIFRHHRRTIAHSLEPR